MAASSLLYFKPPFPNANPRLLTYSTFSATADRNGGGPPTEKKSLAAATGELFMGIASLLISPSSKVQEVLANGSGVYLKGEGERDEEIAKVMEDPIDEEVVWEQREKDVEAEKEGKKVKSPGFSFPLLVCCSHIILELLSVCLRKGILSQFIMVQETTLLDGSSAGAIVCAVIASVNSMQEALQATNVLAEDCRLNGTAFRLGVRVCAFPVNRIGLGGIGVSPDCNPENMASPRQLFHWALEPAADEILDKLYELGYLDAAVWADQNPIVSTAR